MDKIWKSICDFVSSLFSTGTVAVGSALTALCSLFGGFDIPLQILLIFSVCDIIAAVLLAVIFKRSPKTEKGGLSSSVFREGVARKFGMFILVVIAYEIEVLIGVPYIRTFVISSFIVSEGISIIETIGLMGVPIPKALTETIEILKQKNDANKQPEQPEQKDEQEENTNDN